MNPTGPPPSSRYWSGWRPRGQWTGRGGRPRDPHGDRRGSRPRGPSGTPGRVHRMYTELTAGYHVDPERLINGVIFDIAYSEMVVVKEIPFYSLREHHLLPFFGTAAVAYIPKGRVIGLSKIPRIVEMYGRRLQVQERLTQQIAEFERLEPQGVGVGLRPPTCARSCAACASRDGDDDLVRARALRTRDRTRAEFFTIWIVGRRGRRGSRPERASRPHHRRRRRCRTDRRARVR